MRLGSFGVPANPRKMHINCARARRAALAKPLILFWTPPGPSTGTADFKTHSIDIATNCDGGGLHPSLDRPTVFSDIRAWLLAEIDATLATRMATRAQRLQLAR